jgi:hypothetical protein
MLTKAEIVAAPITLDATDKQMWLSLIHANQYYRDNKAIYPDISAQLDAASGTVKGQMLNAISARIQSLGVGEVKLQTPDEGLGYSQHDERDALVAYALSVMYDAVLYVNSTTAQETGYPQVRQRGRHYSAVHPYPLCYICGYYHLGICNTWLP